MFTAATAAASTDLRSKRHHFASSRSFSTSDLNHIKRRQKIQTANALDILSTYLVTSASEDPYHRVPPSSRTSVSSRDSSRACSPVPEDSAISFSPPARSNSTSVKSSNSFLSHLLPGHGQHHQHHSHHQQNHQLGHHLSLPLPSLSSSLSLSTSSLDTKSAAATVAMLKNPAWNEIARLSHSNDPDEVDSHGNRCGHRRGRLYDRQSNPFGAYMARKRFISAINRIRMESMVCAALNNPTSRKTSSTSTASTAMSEHDLRPPDNYKMTKSATSPIPPIIINEEELEDSISMNELRAEIEANSPQHHHHLHQRGSPPGRASSSPQIAADQSQQWSPLLHGRSIDRSFSSLCSRPTNFIATSDLTDSSSSQQRQRSSSASSMAKFLEDDNHRSAEGKCHSTLNAKHSFMALIRIKMFSMKRHRKSDANHN